MAKISCITRASSLASLLPNKTIFFTSFRTTASFPYKPFSFLKSFSYSTTKTPYPLQYEMIIPRPAQSEHHHPRRRLPPPLPPPNSKSPNSPDPNLGFDDWVDMKLASESAARNTPKIQIQDQNQNQNQNHPVLVDDEMNKSKRRYYNKRRKRMYGSDSEDDGDNAKHESKYIELKQDVVKLRTLHKREEELYFYDAFAYPWEKDKHYKMVYQLEKKYFPDQCFDKAFLEPGQSNQKNANAEKMKKRKVVGVVDGGVKNDEKALVFFDEDKYGKGEKENKDVKMDVTEKKVEEFFKCLKKVPNQEGEVDNVLPFISSKSAGLPPKWDGPTGAVVLVNKPKG